MVMESRDRDVPISSRVSRPRVWRKGFEFMLEFMISHFEREDSNRLDRDIEIKIKLSSPRNDSNNSHQREFHFSLL